MATAAGALLGFYLLALAGVWLFAPRSNDPQRGQADGCALLLAGGLVGLAGLLAVGVWADVPVFVRAVFFVAVLPVALCTGAAVRWAGRRLFAR
jgi:hypothetical protein